MHASFGFHRSTLACALLIAAGFLATQAQAGRPLDVDDAGVNAKGHGHVEIWSTRAVDGARSWTVAPAFAPIDGFELAYLRAADQSTQDTGHTLQFKGLITPSNENGCNQAATVGITRRNHALAGARYGWLINTCNQGWGSWHTNIGATQDYSESYNKPLVAMALEFSGFPVVPHIQWIAQKQAMPQFGLGVRKAVTEQFQIDGSFSRQGGQSIWTVGTKFSF